MDAYLANAFGGAVVIALGVLIQLLWQINSKLSVQGEKLALIGAFVGIDGNGLASRVATLEENWNQDREDELQSLRRRRAGDIP
jgi:hypothetical protein